MIMRKLLLIFALCLGVLLPAYAQKGLQIDNLFSGKLVDMSMVSESIVSGKKLVPYNLDYFRSVRFMADEKQISKVTKWIRDDAQLAEEQDMESENGRLVYALLKFPRRMEKNRYVGYQVKRISGKDYVTVVYMEGSATVEDLKVIFKHR